MFSGKLEAKIFHEQHKGCCKEIHSRPVKPEPAYEPDFEVAAKGDPSPKPSHVWDDASLDFGDIVRLKIWVSPVQKCDWNRAELMVKQFSFLKHRAAMEVVGNCKKIAVQFMCHKDDVAVIKTAFKGQFEQCHLAHASKEVLTAVSPELWEDMVFWDFYPPPPYSNLFTSYDELQRSPYTTLFNALADLPKTVVGFYQIVFEPVDIRHNWHMNVKQLLDILYKIKSHNSTPDVPRYLEQPPSSSLSLVSNKLEIKCHNDKPFFAASVRFGVLNPKKHSYEHILKVSEMASLFLHGCNLMRKLTDTDYRKIIPQKDFRKMFLSGTLYRPGFILNSKELTGFIHVPSPDISEHISHILKPLETLPPDDKPAKGKGVKLGYCDYADVKMPVYIPSIERFKHTHILGTTGTGKSHLLLQMIQADIIAGHGVAVIDPHGQLLGDLLELIPSEYADKVIYLNPGDSEYIPVWNPFNCGNIDKDRIALDITDSFKSFGDGFGRRLEHILRQAILGVLHLPGGSFFDVNNLLRKKSPESDQLIKQITNCTDDPSIKHFWNYDFANYGSNDIQPVHHKLSAIMAEFTVRLMLSQRYSSFELVDIMNSGKILLVDLSCVGTEVKKVLGCLMLSLLCSTAMNRDPKKQYRSCLPFHIHCDEAHMFVTDALEDIIAQVRKAKVSLTLAHQFMKQFDSTKVGALTSVGSRLIFAVNEGDAAQLKKAMLGKVQADDLINLGLGQVIARVNNKVVRFNTESKIIKSGIDSNAIIENSRRHYYVPIKDAKKEVFSRNGYERLPQGFDLSNLQLKKYDEF